MDASQHKIPGNTQVDNSQAPGPVTLAQAFRYWLKLGFISFGGPAGQIAIMHQDLVEKQRWISERRFLHALNYCMLLPGPEAQQLAIYIGWIMHRTWGGIVAGMFLKVPDIMIVEHHLAIMLKQQCDGAIKVRAITSDVAGAENTIDAPELEQRQRFHHRFEGTCTSLSRPIRVDSAGASLAAIFNHHIDARTTANTPGQRKHCVNIVNITVKVAALDKISAFHLFTSVMK